MKWFRATFPDVMIFAIPNGGARHPAVANKLKAEGVLAGVADLYVPAWKLWVEMKRQKGGKWTDEQKKFCDYVTKECGDDYMIARGANDGITTIEREKGGDYIGEQQERETEAERQKEKVIGTRRGLAAARLNEVTR